NSLLIYIVLHFSHFVIKPSGTSFFPFLFETFGLFSLFGNIRLSNTTPSSWNRLKSISFFIIFIFYLYYIIFFLYLFFYFFISIIHSILYFIITNLSTINQLY